MAAKEIASAPKTEGLPNTLEAIQDSIKGAGPEVKIGRDMEISGDNLMKLVAGSGVGCTLNYGLFFRAVPPIQLPER